MTVLRRSLLARRPGERRRAASRDGDGTLRRRDRERRHHARSSKAGWNAPEVFVAKGRDGKTDIWGIVWQPTRFDPSKKYPVIEYIYAGPHGSLTPKSFIGHQRHAGPGRTRLHRRADGRHGHVEPLEGVPRRCWKNLNDAGFPDRILWHKAVAAKNPWYDITRVGIYGGSAGGQNAMGALLFHPDFYKVGGVVRRLPRQPHGQDLVERAVDGLAGRPAVRRIVERRPRATCCRASCC